MNDIIILFTGILWWLDFVIVIAILSVIKNNFIKEK